MLYVEKEKMIDNHYHPENWGVAPELFHIGPLSIPSYEFFVLLALLVGGLVYWWLAKKEKRNNERSFLLAFAAIIGGSLGAKIPHWIMNFDTIIATFPDPTAIFVGRTIVGGLIGGTIGVIIAKRWLGIKSKHGNLFAPAGAIGIAIGRIGCFLRGCCYGTETSLPWGVDFGDGVLRHPTQLYETLFGLVFFVYLLWARKRNPKPGVLFWQFLVAYFIFRFLTEFIRTDPQWFLGLTSFQWVSLLMLAWLFRHHILKLAKNCMKK